MAAKPMRSFGLSDEQVAKLKEQYQKSKRFPNPYRAGAYAHIISAIVALGTNRAHPLAKVHTAFKRAAGAEWYDAWEKQDKRNEETGLDADGRLVQNLRVLQRTADYGKKVLEVGQRVLGSKGAVLDLTRDSKGALLVALNLDSDKPLKPGRAERKTKPTAQKAARGSGARQDASGAAKAARKAAAKRNKQSKAGKGTAK